MYQEPTFRTLKRVVIKEELVALTGDFKSAVILNQFIFWSQRVQDFDKFIGEEQARAAQCNTSINIEKTHGWIYKSAEELSAETMLGLSSSSTLRHIKKLVENGWLSERQNPKYSWDRTRQYRVNLIKIHQDMEDIGYTLQDYKIEVPFSKIENAISKIENGDSILKNGSSILENRTSKIENRTVQNRKAIPKITTDINNVVVEQRENLEVDSESTIDAAHIWQASKDKPTIPKEVEDLINRVSEISGAAISDAFAREVLLQYTPELVAKALRDLKNQIDRGMEITTGVGAWLRTWLQRNYEPDQKPPQTITKETRKSYIKRPKGNGPVNPDTAGYDARKKAFIRTLYL